MKLIRTVFLDIVFGALAFAGFLPVLSSTGYAATTPHLPDATELMNLRSSSLAAKIQSTLPQIADETPGYEWNFQNGQARISETISPQEPSCRLQVSRLRGIKLSQLRNRSIRVSEISPFNTQTQNGTTLSYLRGAFFALEFRSGSQLFAGKLTCIAQGTTQASFTLGDARQALAGVLSLDKKSGSTAVADEDTDDDKPEPASQQAGRVGTPYPAPQRLLIPQPQVRSQTSN